MSNIKDLLQKGMSMIASAGDGRTLIVQAMDAAKENKYDDAEQLLEQAYEKIKDAHIVQTHEIQERMADDSSTEEAARLLFTHAQDTLMTINSEYLVCKQMIDIMKNYDERLKKLEEKL